MSSEFSGFLTIVVSGTILAAAAYMVLHAKRGALGSLSSGAVSGFDTIAKANRGQ